MTARSALHLFCGMIGAGKTTRARAFERQTGAVRFSPDEWLLLVMRRPDDRAEMDRLRPAIERVQWRLARVFLRRGRSVCLENGFWTMTERVALCREARDLGARVVLHLLDPPRAELHRRVSARNPKAPSRALMVTPSELDYWFDRFEKPQAEELALYDETYIHRR